MFGMIDRYCTIGGKRYVLVRGLDGFFVCEWPTRVEFSFCFAGTKEECKAWLQAKREEVEADEQN